jgi:hypothetical protein
MDNPRCRPISQDTPLLRSVAVSCCPNGKMFGDLARYLMHRQEVTEPLKGFEQDQKANSESSALGDFMGQRQFLGRGRKDGVQFLFRKRTFQTWVGGIVDARQAAFLHDFRRCRERSRIIVAAGGRDGMREVVELNAVSGCLADFGRIVAWAQFTASANGTRPTRNPKLAIVRTNDLPIVGCSTSAARSAGDTQETGRF